MVKNVVIISASLREESNSAALAEAFGAGAKAAGHQVEKFSLKDKTIGFCKGCLACQKTRQCVIRDDAAEIVKAMGLADILVFATPIYYYEMSGQMKTLLDRANPLFAAEYAFRNIYLLTTAAEADEATPERAVQGLCGWIDCFTKASLAGAIFAGGVNSAGEIAGHPALKEAYDMGAAIQ